VAEHLLGPPVEHDDVEGLRPDQEVERDRGADAPGASGDGDLHPSGDHATGQEEAEAAKIFENTIPLHRHATAEEVARAVLVPGHRRLRHGRDAGGRRRDERLTKAANASTAGGR
jgi:hypothetical protein